MKITVVKNWNGEEEVHKAGCADLKKRTNRPYRLSEALTMDADNLGDLYRVYWECIDEENVYDGSPYATLEEVWWAWRSEFRLMPCAGDVPEMDDPTAEKKDEEDPATEWQKAHWDEAVTNGTGSRSGNQELARWLVDLVAANSGDLSAPEQQKVANWLKALPTGGAGPDRYWPANLTRPSTADWKR